MNLLQPLLCLAIAVLMFTVHMGLLKSAVPERGSRETVLSVATLWGLCIWAVSELLSLGHRLNFFWITSVWLSAALATILAAVVRHKPLARCLRRIPQQWCQFTSNRTESLLIVATLPGLVCLAIIALVAAPGNWDSQTYHLSRVMHWIQNESLAFYPTHIPRQLYLGPGAEILVLHAQILSGGDRLASVIQYTAMLGSLLGVSCIAKLLGGRGRVQLFTAVAAGTIPMGILQATSTQNDYVTGFWLVCFVAFGLAAKEEPTWRVWFLAGVSLGLAILTKATAYLFAAPFIVWFGVSQLKRDRLTAFKVAALIGGLVLLINIGHYSRNGALFGSVLGPPGEGNLTYRNELFTPAALLSNVVRNVALHLGLPRLSGVNRLTQQTVSDLHAVLRVPVDDLRTTWAGEGDAPPAVEIRRRLG